MKNDNDFKFELRDYLKAMIDDSLQEMDNYEILIVSTLDPLQRRQYENEVRHIEKHLFELNLLYKMTMER